MASRDQSKIAMLVNSVPLCEYHQIEKGSLSVSAAQTRLSCTEPISIRELLLLFDGLGPSGFHPWRRFDNDLARTVLRTDIF